MLELLINTYRKYKFSASEKCSFSQCGEDLIIDFIFFQMGIDKPSYLDIGAYHPFRLSNTYFFYLKGAKGVNIEPDPTGIRLFNRYRNRDTNLCAGVGKNKTVETAEFYVMSSKRLNTLVKEEALRIEASSKYRIQRVETIQLLPVEYLFEKHFNNQAPDFISLDVEGFDLDILETIDFTTRRPKVICVETIEFEEKNASFKNTAIIEFMKDKNYFVYADTFINSIFVDKTKWQTKEN